jgi:hypothetical protein
MKDVNVEDERKGKDPAWLLSHPRELCKHCSEWNECEETPWDDISGCSAPVGVTGNDYLLGSTDTCKYFFEY